MSGLRLLAMLLLCTAATLAGAAVQETQQAQQAQGAADAAAVPPAKNAQQCPAGTETEEEEEEEEEAWSPAMQDYLATTAGLPRPEGTEQARMLAETVLADRAFGGSHDEAHWTWQWRFKGTPAKQDKPATDTPLAKLFEWLAGLSTYFGTLGHIVLWLALLAVLLLVWHRRQALLALLPQRRDSSEFVAGIDILPLLAPDALPEDVITAAQHLWDHGHPRDALGLLYRAALYRLGDRLAFAIPPSGTEQECLRLVRRHADTATTDAFRQLVNAWMRSAWANEPPAGIGALLDAYRVVAAIDAPRTTPAPHAGAAT